MEIELDTQEIYEKIYDFLLEKGLSHTAFVLRNEARLNNNFKENKLQSSLLTIYTKGKLYEQYENDQLQELDSELQSISNDGFQNQIDQRILKSYNFNRQVSKESISVKKQPSVQSIQESEKVAPLETYFKYLIYDEYILGYDRNSQQIYYFSFMDDQNRNLKSFRFNNIKGKFQLFKHLCISQKHQIFFINLETFTFQKQISLKEEDQFVQLNFYHNKYILTTNTFTLILNEQLENEYMIPKKIKKLVSSLNSLYMFSNEENLLYEYQVAHKTLLNIQLPTNHCILNCSASDSSSLFVLLSQNQENQNIYSIYHEGQEEYLIQWRIKKFLSKIRIHEKQMIIFDDQTFHHCDFVEQQVKFRHSFKNYQIEDIYWIDQDKILIQLAGNIYKKFDLESKNSINIEKTSANYKILYSEKIKKLVEIENPDMFSSDIKPMKIRAAIFFGYNGKPFHGLQKVQGVPTVEEFLEKAFFDIGLISSNNYGDIKKVGWNRGSRTDKGVHASLNTIKCNITLNQEFLKDIPEEEKKKNGQVNKTTFKQYIDFDKVKQRINSVLREDIRVFAIRLVTKNFVCKNSATSRKYEYFMPLSILKTEKHKDTTNEEFIKEVKKTLQLYLGTKNFHNYTKKGNYKDKSSNRHIMDIDVQLYKADTEKPFIQIYIHGQSFMYNQIRKMIGGIVQVFQNDFPEDFIKNSFAPAEGLLLDRIQFKGYNSKTDIPEKLEITEEEEKEIQKFQQQQIYDKIIEECTEKDVFEDWLEEKKYF